MKWRVTVLCVPPETWCCWSREAGQRRSKLRKHPKERRSMWIWSAQNTVRQLTIRTFFSHFYYRFVFKYISTNCFKLVKGSLSRVELFNWDLLKVRIYSVKYIEIFLSSVGLDIQQKFSPFFSGPKRYGAESLTPEQHNTVQQAQANAQRSQGATQRTQPTAQETQKRNSTSTCATEKGRLIQYLTFVYFELLLSCTCGLTRTVPTSVIFFSSLKYRFLTIRSRQKTM